YDQMHERLTRAQDIVIELQNGLRPDKDPDNCKRLESLYGWCYLRLVEGNVGRDPDKIEEALGVLRYQRETWQMIAAARANEAATLAAADEQRGGLRLAG
ncbi:MAG: flagellar export chaperone FliS, partial [Planctomycetota bacterium]